MLKSFDPFRKGDIVSIKHWSVRLSFYLVLAIGLLTVLFILSGVADEDAAFAPGLQPPAEPVAVHVPAILRNYPWSSPFGVEVHWRHPLTGGTLLARAEELNIQWVRLHRVSWRDVQPVEGGAYDWSVLGSFEDELRAMRSAGLTPIVIVHHSPRWATINEPFETDCGAVRADKFGAFAAFVQALVERYKQPEFNVRYWELGNEPDVDPQLVTIDSPFGCWGDIDDPYYGGRHYGEMLKVVTPAIKAADPEAKVLIGGLLLATPNTTNPDLGKPELFLQGILEAEAAPYFDIVPYHAYPSYFGEVVDYDNGTLSGDWYSWGGWTLGKARFLRQVMALYGVNKSLFLNETSLGCNPDWYDCDPPPSTFFEAQADFVVRTFTRDLSENIQAFVWYTLDGPGWREGGLLDSSDVPRLSYLAYQQLATRLQNSRFEQVVDYGLGIEAYSFAKGTRCVHVLWSIDAVADTISVPQAKFLAAYDRDGASLSPTPVGSDYQFTVGFSPIYVELYK
jgi:hypothetical protein